MKPVVLETLLPKLRISERTPFWDIYTLNSRVLLVGLDRVSYQGKIFSPIPYKGLYTVQTVSFLYEELEQANIPTHYLTSDVRRMSSIFQVGQEVIRGRSLLLKRTSCIPLRCEVIRYAYGPFFQNPRYFSTLAQGPFPKKPREGEAFEEPVLFVQGKKRNGQLSYLSSGQTAEIIGDKIAEEISELSRMGFAALEQAFQKAGWILGRVVFFWGFYGKEIVLAKCFYGEEDLTLWKKLPRPQSLALFPPSYEVEPLADFIKQGGKTDLEKVLQTVSKRFSKICQSLTGYTVKE